MTDLNDLKQQYVKDPKDLEIARLEVERDELKERIASMHSDLAAGRKRIAELEEARAADVRQAANRIEQIQQRAEKAEAKVKELEAWSDSARVLFNKVYSCLPEDRKMAVRELLAKRPKSASDKC